MILYKYRLSAFFITLFSFLGITSLWILDWLKVAAKEGLYSYTLLIPFISIYLIIEERKFFKWNSSPSPRTGLSLLILSVIAGLGLLIWQPIFSDVDHVAIRMLIFCFGILGILFLFFGKHWIHSACFPMFFLFFVIPLPDSAVLFLEKYLMYFSAILADILFQFGNIPVFRKGQIIELPGVVLEVAQACSGIRSTLVLLITSILAAHLFLPTLGRKLILVGAVLPLGVFRNALRIYVIGWLCCEYGPQMIEHWIHRKGGPLFFILSLLPLLYLVFLLRKKFLSQI